VGWGDVTGRQQPYEGLQAAIWGRLGPRTAVDERLKVPEPELIGIWLKIC
jgi:hypothetical protein